MTYLCTAQATASIARKLAASRRALSANAAMAAI
jgi:hypothetical protein